MRRTNLDDIHEDYDNMKDSSQDKVRRERTDSSVPRQPHRKRGKNRRLKQILYTVGFVVVMVVILAFGARAYYLSGMEPKDPGSQDSVVVTIPEGSSIADTAKILDKAGVIKNSIIFQSYVGRHSYGGQQIMAANYQLSPGMTVPELYDILTSGKAYHGAEYIITIPEGKNVNEMGDIVAQSGLCTKEAFVAEAGKLDYYRSIYPILQSIPEEKVPSRTLEGYLFPDTYHVYVDEGKDPAAELVNAMLTNFTKNFTDQMIAQAESQGKTVDDIVTMASVVELETKLPEDRKDAASVFYNRIAQNMPLQSDITVDYALGEKNAVLTTEQVQTTDSPYNTYLNLGLPYGPICSPGLASIDAALNPNQTDYLYFVADMSTGKLHFNSTLQGHEQDVATYMSDEIVNSVQ